MIDEKKIEEAAKEYAEQQEKICKELAEKHTSTSSICSIVSKNPDAAFKDGINWFLDNLKRPMNESPKMGDLVLIVHNMEQYELRHGNKNVNLAFTHELDFHDNWKDTYAKNSEYKYWINVDEIIDLQKGGK